METTINFIDVIKRHEPIYDTTHNDYKNIERKAKAWRSVAHEVGLTVEASKRKWKNLRDSYTKYLRSFRTGTKTSRKYQYWAHAGHMEFLKPFQGPGRSQQFQKYEIYENYTNPISHFKHEPACDLGFEMLDKSSPEEISMDEMVNKIDPVINGTNGKEFSSTKEIMNSTNLEKQIMKHKDLDATSMFFLSLAKSVKAMPRKQQAAVKMHCMKIVSDAEIEIENTMIQIENDLSAFSNMSTCYQRENITSSSSYQSGSNNPPPQADTSEHFLYVMSPSRVEAMIDISSEDELTEN